MGANAQYAHSDAYGHDYDPILDRSTRDLAWEMAHVDHHTDNITNHKGKGKDGGKNHNNYQQHESHQLKPGPGYAIATHGVGPPKNHARDSAAERSMSQIHPGFMGVNADHNRMSGVMETTHGAGKHNKSKGKGGKANSKSAPTHRSSMANASAIIGTTDHSR